MKIVRYSNTIHDTGTEILIVASQCSSLNFSAEAFRVKVSDVVREFNSRNSQKLGAHGWATGGGESSWLS
jgi:hypothetical protein